jgi:hypothetical protein
MTIYVGSYVRHCTDDSVVGVVTALQGSVACVQWLDALWERVYGARDALPLADIKPVTFACPTS